MLGLRSGLGGSLGAAGLLVASMIVLSSATSGGTWAGNGRVAAALATPAATPGAVAAPDAVLSRRVAAAVEGAGSYRFERYDLSGGERRLVRVGAVDLERGSRSLVVASGATVVDVGGVRYLGWSDGRWERAPVGEPDALELVLDELKRGTGGWTRGAPATVDGERAEVLRTTEPVTLAETTAEERTLWVDAETALPLRYRERGVGPIGPYELGTEFEGFGEEVDLTLPAAALAVATPQAATANPVASPAVGPTSGAGSGDPATTARAVAEAMLAAAAADDRRSPGAASPGTGGLRPRTTPTAWAGNQASGATT